MLLHLFWPFHKVCYNNNYLTTHSTRESEDDAVTCSMVSWNSTANIENMWSHKSQEKDVKPLVNTCSHMNFLHMWNSCFFCDSRQYDLFDGNITCKQPLRLTWRCSSWGWCPSRPPERTPSARSATLAAYCLDTPPVHTAETHTHKTKRRITKHTVI